VLAASTSAEFQAELEHRTTQKVNWLFTTAFSEKPVSMSYRGVYQFYSRKGPTTRGTTRSTTWRGWASGRWRISYGSGSRGTQKSVTARRKVLMRKKPTKNPNKSGKSPDLTTITSDEKSTAPSPSTDAQVRSLSGQISAVNGLNERLADISHRLYGERLALRIVNPRSLRKMRKNARYMPKEMFDQLVKNVTGDGNSSVPLCHTLADGSLEVISGNHGWTRR
jgi:hypothetical protein